MKILPYNLGHVFEERIQFIVFTDENTNHCEESSTEYVKDFFV